MKAKDLCEDIPYDIVDVRGRSLEVGDTIVVASHKVRKGVDANLYIVLGYNRNTKVVYYIQKEFYDPTKSYTHYYFDTHAYVNNYVKLYKAKYLNDPNYFDLDSLAFIASDPNWNIIVPTDFVNISDKKFFYYINEFLCTRWMRNVGYRSPLTTIDKILPYKDSGLLIIKRSQPNLVMKINDLC